MCRAQVGKGVRGGEEAERRSEHLPAPPYVAACSFCSGRGALWAGKGFRTMLYGALLSVSAGLFTVSWSAGRGTGGLIGDMQADVWRAALGATAVSLAVRIVWGWRSFDALQRDHNVAGERL